MPRAVDTNVLVRFLTTDDADQAARARTAIDVGDILVTLTVLLECEWVLRRSYGFAPARVAAQLREVLNLPGVAVERSPVAHRALDWAEGGMDLADALHLAQAEDCTAFLSFDRKLARDAASRSPVPVLEP